MPWIITEAQICKTFGWTPLELAEQPLDEVMMLWHAYTLFENKRAKRLEQKMRKK